MRDFFSSVRFKILAAILLVLFGFMVAAVYTGGSSALFGQLLGAVTEPLQKLSSRITGGVSGVFDKYLNAAATHEENEQLRREVARLREQLVDYEKVRHEYEQLQKIADVRERRQDLSFETASVISRDYSTPFAAFTIDKGTLDDVSLHDPVITEDGLVGYVTEVGLSSARITTILDINMNVGASNSATRDIGNVTGAIDLAADGLCRMEYLPRDSGTQPGHIIVTSGGSLFPKDLVIGTVESVATSTRGNSLEAVIRPAADVAAVKDVFVILHFEGQGAD